MKNLSTTPLLCIALIGIFLSGTALRITYFIPYINPLLFISGLVILVITLLVKKENIKVHINSFTLIYGLCILFYVVSSFQTGDGSGLLISIKFSFVFVVFMICLPNMRGVFTFRIIATSFIISSTLILLISFIVEPPNTFIIQSYSGIFANPNSLGLLAVTLFSLVLVLFISNTFYKLNVGRSIFLFITLLLLLIIISMSSSRTSFVTALVLVSVVFVLYIFKAFNVNSFNINQIFRLFIIIFVIVSGITIFLNSNIYEVIDEGIISKFVERTNSMSSGRVEIWEEILETSKLIGQSDYSVERDNMSAHSTFLSNIGNYGWLLGITYILFWLVALIQSLIFFKQNNGTDRYSLFPFLSVLTFVLLSMTEVLTFNSAELLALCAIGYSFYKVE